MDSDLANGRETIALPVSNRRVVFLRIDYSLGLVIEHQDGVFDVRISDEFTFHSAGKTHTLNAERRPQELGPLMTIPRIDIRNASVRSDGALRIVFADGSSIVVPPSIQYEAWEVVGPHGYRIVSLPGGELATWQLESLDTG